VTQSVDWSNPPVRCFTGVPRHKFAPVQYKLIIDFSYLLII